jgi:type VI secretion system protein ImpH
MASPRRRKSPPLIERLFAEPHRFRFFQAVRLLEREASRRAARRGGPKVGEEAEPRFEPVRFRSHVSLGFTPSEIVEMKPSPEPREAGGARPPPEMTVAFFGLAGAKGVLPFHYTALLIRSLRAKSVALRDFLDVFNHRLIALFARAWAKYRLPIVYEGAAAPGTDPISASVRALVGLGGETLHGHTRVGDETILHYAGHFAHNPRSASGLEAVLSDYFRRAVRVEQFRGRWLNLSPMEQTALPGDDERRGRYAELGSTATLGRRVWDVQGSFRLHIGPLDYAQFLRFMPDGEDLKRAVELTELYVGTALRFDVQLTLRKDCVPATRLDGMGRLGWNSWLRHQPFIVDASDAVFLR